MGLFGRKKKEETPFVTVVIAAAGASRRMGGENKQLILLDGVPVLGRTLLAFQRLYPGDHPGRGGGAYGGICGAGPAAEDR